MQDNIVSVLRGFAFSSTSIAGGHLDTEQPGNGTFVTAITSAQALAGTREVQVMLHRMGMWPSGALAPAALMWKPPACHTKSGSGSGSGSGGSAMQLRESTPEESRLLWIWVHMDAVQDVIPLVQMECIHKVLWKTLSLFSLLQTILHKNDSVTRICNHRHPHT